MEALGSCGQFPCFSSVRLTMDSLQLTEII